MGFQEAKTIASTVAGDPNDALKANSRRNIPVGKQRKSKQSLSGLLRESIRREIAPA